MNEQDWQCRTELLLGEENIGKLKRAHVLVAGVGGVGGYAAEQLCRAGVGKLTLVDNDIVQPSNRNRQIIALSSTQGLKKTQIIAARLKDINPDLELILVEEFLDETNITALLEQPYNFVIDAIDTLTPKVTLLVECVNRNIPVISSMGSGGKIDPSKIQLADIEKSSHCKFAYIVRKYLHRRGIQEGIRVVFSTENVPRKAIVETDGSGNKRSTIGTISYMPAIFGCFCASEVIRGIIMND